MHSILNHKQWRNKNFGNWNILARINASVINQANSLPWRWRAVRILICDTTCCNVTFLNIMTKVYMYKSTDRSAVLISTRYRTRHDKVEVIRRNDVFTRWRGQFLYGIWSLLQQINTLTLHSSRNHRSIEKSPLAIYRPDHHPIIHVWLNRTPMTIPDKWPLSTHCLTHSL